MSATTLVVCITWVPELRNLSANPVGWPTAAGEHSLDAYSEYALETALKLRDSAPEGTYTITALCVGPLACKEGLKKAIAAGADAAILVESGHSAPNTPAQTATLLAKAIQAQANVGAVFCGMHSIEGASGLTPGALAANLGWPVLGPITQCNAVATGLEVLEEGASETLTWQTTGPTVFTVGKCAYELRLAGIKGVMRANKTEITLLSATEFAPGLENSVTLTQSNAKPPKAAGVKLVVESPSQGVQQVLANLVSLGALR